jgi:hypothetical protein
VNNQNVQLSMFVWRCGHAYPKDWSPNMQYLSNEADTRKDKNLVICNSGLEWKVLLILCGIGLKFQ